MSGTSRIVTLRFAIFVLALHLPAMISGQESGVVRGSRDKIRIAGRASFGQRIDAVVVGRSGRSGVNPAIVGTVDSIQMKGRGQTFRTLPKADTNSKALVFQDEFGKVLSVLEVAGFDAELEGPSAVRFVVMDRTGRTTLRIERGLPPSVLPKASPSGDYALAWNTHSAFPTIPILFRDDGSSVTWRIGDRSGEWPKGFRIQLIRFSQDGSKFALVGDKNGQQVTVVYDRNGAEIWRLKAGGNIRFSPKGTYVAFFQGKALSLFDDRGGSLPVPIIAGLDWVQHVRFSEDERQFVLATREGRLFLCELSSAKVLWERRLQGPPRSEPSSGERVVNGLEVAADLSVIALSGLDIKEMSDGEGPYARKRLQALSEFITVFSGSGEFVDELTLPPNALTLGDRNHAVFFISVDGSELLVPSGGEILKLSVGGGS